MNIGPHRFALDWHNAGRNEKIRAKVSLAEQYRLVPQGINEYLDAITHFTESFQEQDSKSSLEIAARNYLEATQAILERRPGGILEGELRYRRGRTIEDLHTLQPSYTVNQAQREYLLALSAPFKAASPYLSSLTHLEQLSLQNNDLQKGWVYRQAGELFTQRKSAGDLHLSTRGVNDFLREQGVSVSN